MWKEVLKETSKELLKVALYLLYVYIWARLILAGGILISFSSILRDFLHGTLLILFSVLSLAVLVSPFYLKRFIKNRFIVPIAAIVMTVILVCVNYGILYASSCYISVFSQEKWARYDSLRTYMVEDMESKYDFIGMTKQQVLDLLGKPYEDTPAENTFSYYIGDAVIDPVLYVFYVEDGIIIKTEIQHT